MSNDFLPDDYTPVHERIKKFRKDYPEGKIATEIYKWEDDMGVFRASVSDEEGNVLGWGTGHATREDDKFVGEKFYEKGETVAVGRALAFAGYGIDEGIASREEVQTATKTKERPNPKNNSKLEIEDIRNELDKKKSLDWYDDESSEPQAKRFAQWWDENVDGGDEDRYEFLSRLLDRQIKSSTELTKGELSTLIELATNKSDKFARLVNACVNDKEEIPF